MTTASEGRSRLGPHGASIGLLVVLDGGLGAQRGIMGWVEWTQQIIDGGAAAPWHAVVLADAADPTADPYRIIALFCAIDVGILVLLTALTWVLGKGINPLRMWRWTFTAGSVVVVLSVAVAFVTPPVALLWTVALFTNFGVLVGFAADVVRLSRRRATQARNAGPSTG